MDSLDEFANMPSKKRYLERKRKLSKNSIDVNIQQDNGAHSHRDSTNMKKKMKT